MWQGRRHTRPGRSGCTLRQAGDKGAAHNANGVARARCPPRLKVGMGVVAAQAGRQTLKGREGQFLNREIESAIRKGGVNSWDTEHKTHGHAVESWGCLVLCSACMWGPATNAANRWHCLSLELSSAMKAFVAAKQWSGTMLGSRLGWTFVH